MKKDSFDCRPDDSQLGSHGGGGLGGGHAGAVPEPEDVGEPGGGDDGGCLPGVLQGLLVDTEEAAGVHEGGVGEEGVGGGHGRGDVQQVVGGRHLSGAGYSWGPGDNIIFDHGEIQWNDLPGGQVKAGAGDEASPSPGYRGAGRRPPWCPASPPPGVAAGSH